MSKRSCEIIRNTIYEAYSISVDVERASNDLGKIILADMKNVESCQKQDDGCIMTYKTNRIQFEAFGETIDVEYISYTSGFQKIKSELVGQTTFHDGGIQIYLNLAVSFGQPIAVYFDGEIFHEMLHVYQFLKEKREKLSNIKERRLYSYINNVLGGEYDDTAKTFASALYLTFDFEQDAMVHGMYATISSKRNPRLTIVDNIKNTIEYRYFEDIVYCIQHIDEFPENVFGDLTAKGALSRLKCAESRFLRKIRNAQFKLIEDINRRLNDEIESGHVDLIPNRRC